MRETQMAVDEQCVLITGGTGSFGSTMTRRLLDAGVKRIKLLSRDEAKPSPQQ